MGVLLGAIVAPLQAQQAGPLNLTGTVSGPTTVVLAWTGSPNAIRYYVQRSAGAAAFANLGTPKITGATYTDAAAPAGSVRYRVIAKFNGAANTYSNIVSVTPGAPASTAVATPAPATPPPGQPTSAPPADASPAVAPAGVIATAAAPLPVLVTAEAAPVTLAPAPAAVPTTPAPTRLEVAGRPAAGRTPVSTAALTPAAVVPSAPAAPAAPATLAPGVIPTNPSGFTAKQIGDGQVQLSWQPVSDASYYVLLGAGVPDGGTKVTGATTFTATGVPPGSHEWAVASYYDPGPVSTPAAEFPRARATVTVMLLTGWADLHTHPMINLAFGGKLVHGGPDVGSLLPTDASCNKGVRAASMEHALGDDRPSHGGWNLVDFSCGDNFRQLLLHKFQEGNGALLTGGAAKGYPDFLDWPKWNDITHQKMWFEWIRRARDGGLRVMVALATNNKTLGDAVSGPGDGPTDDKASADLQLNEIKLFVSRHLDFMEIARGPADIKRIVQANKIAVVLGVEIDNIGNLNLLPPGALSGPLMEPVISGEINRLYDAGVRYILPIHIMDNAFGGTAIYKDDFNTSNLREAGHYWDIECANSVDGITYRYTDGYDVLRAAAAFVKIGIDPFRRSGPGPACNGHRNKRGLTLQGMFAIKHMMKRGMIVDIDHMSEHSAESTLDIAEKFGYPVVSGHTGIRGSAGANAENSRSQDHLQRISRLHGMLGLGSDGVNRASWANQYRQAMKIMGYQHADTSKAVYRNGAISFGTDLNGLVKGPPPGGSNSCLYNASFPKSSSGSKTWNYQTDGVVHYGMLADFVRDVSTAGSNNCTSSGSVSAGAVSGSELVDHHLNRSANYFWQMWERIESRKGTVQ
jgi:microsomal dipeptidase-like Zn-dependent dipeptidase